MDIIYAKLIKGKNKYRKVLTTNEQVYEDVDIKGASTYLYTPRAVLEDGEWFYVENVSQKEYSIDLFKLTFQSVDMDLLEKKDFKEIDFIFIKSEDCLYFQNVSKSKLVSKKTISFGETFTYKSNCTDIVIKDLPDAVYNQKDDILYFRKLESITSVFKGIDQIYREATQAETEYFLKNDFIQLKSDYSADRVKTANRKRIALAAKTLSNLSADDRKNVFSYIGEYCPNLKAGDTAFEVGTEEELKMLLFGIEQRFYTTPVGNEKRIANSVIVFSETNRASK